MGDEPHRCYEREIRAYLASLLPPGEVDSAVEWTVAHVRYWRDCDLDDVLRHARLVRRARLHVPADHEAAVLVAEAGVDHETAAAITGLTPDKVRRAVEERRASGPNSTASDQAPGRQADGTIPSGRQVVAIGLGLVALIGLVLAIFFPDILLGR